MNKNIQLGKEYDIFEIEKVSFNYMGTLHIPNIHIYVEYNSVGTICLHKQLYLWFFPSSTAIQPPPSLESTLMYVDCQSQSLFLFVLQNSQSQASKIGFVGHP